MIPGTEIGGLLGAALALTMLCLVGALGAAAWRLFVGPTLADRVVALDLVSALVNLGYHRQAVDKVLDKVVAASPGARFEDVLRVALKEIARA